MYNREVVFFLTYIYTIGSTTSYMQGACPRSAPRIQRRDVEKHCPSGSWLRSADVAGKRGAPAPRPPLTVGHTRGPRHTPGYLGGRACAQLSHRKRVCAPKAAARTRSSAVWRLELRLCILTPVTSSLQPGACGRPLPPAPRTDVSRPPHMGRGIGRPILMLLPF